MKGFVGIGHSDHVETAIEEATAGLKKADFLIVIAGYTAIEKAAELLAGKYPGTPMIGTSGDAAAKHTMLSGQLVVIGFAGVEVCTGLIEDVRTTPVKSIPSFEENLNRIAPGDADTICLEFVTGCEERVLSTMHAPLAEAGVPLIGASAFGVLLGERHLVVRDGKTYSRSLAYAILKNKGGHIRVYKENIYKRQSRRAHFASLVEPGTKTLFQLDGTPALEIYEHETGTEPDQLTATMPRHPLGRALGSDTCIIQTMSVDRNGVMFNGKAIYENDSIYIMELGDYRQIHQDFLDQILADGSCSFLLGCDSPNRLQLFTEDAYLEDYLASFDTLCPSALFVGDGQQLDNQHMNQTLVVAAFE